MANRSPSRRRQRRVRVTVAVGILAVATAVAVPALLVQLAIWLSVAVVVTLAGGISATRIVYTEMLQDRRDNAVQRARLVDANRTSSVALSRENMVFAEAMGRKVKGRDKSINELEGTILLAEKRASIAEHRARHETANAKESNLALAELQQRVQDAKAELVDELAVWEGAEFDTVIDLMTWEERVMTKAELATLRDDKKQA